MNISHENYQEGKIVFSFWKLAIMKATDGSGTVWVVLRLLDGKEELRELIDMSEEYGA